MVRKNEAQSEVPAEQSQTELSLQMQLSVGVKGVLYLAGSQAAKPLLQ